jgi:hypothetical protein
MLFHWPSVFAPVARGADLERVRDRPADPDVGLVSASLPKPGRRPPSNSSAGLARRDDHRARDRVAAVERALRALQHLDLRDARELLVERVRVGLQHAVDHEREVGLGVAARVDAADADLQVAGFGRLHLRDARRERDEVRRALDAGVPDVRRRERLDGDGHVRDALLALACGHDDLAELAVRRRLGRGSHTPGPGPARRRRSRRAGSVAHSVWSWAASQLAVVGPRNFRIRRRAAGRQELVRTISPVRTLYTASDPRIHGRLCRRNARPGGPRGRSCAECPPFSRPFSASTRGACPGTAWRSCCARETGVGEALL